MDTHEPRVTNTLFLAAEPNAPSLSRALVRLVLRQWGLRDVVDEAEIVVSELATNAVQATGDDPSYYANGVGLPAVIRVQVALFDSHMFIGVWDRGLDVPKSQSASAIDESGRGLLIVENLSADWGYETVHPGSGHKGKVVWAELALPRPPVMPNSLPRRMPGVAVAEMATVIDVKVLERVRDALLQM